MERLLKRAHSHATDPNLFAGLVHACRYCGLLEASAAAHECALRLAPHVRTSVAHTYTILGAHRKALDSCGPTDMWIRPKALEVLGRKQQTTEQLRGVASANPWIVFWRTLLEEGDGQKSLDALNRAQAAFPVHTSDPEARFFQGCLLAKLNDTGRAFEFVSVALDEGYHCLYALLHEPDLEPLRSHRHFPELVNRATVLDRRARTVFLDNGGDRLLSVNSDTTSCPPPRADDPWSAIVLKSGTIHVVPTRFIRTLLAAAMLVAIVDGQSTFAPPSASSAVLKGIPFKSGTSVGEKFRGRFTECDSSDKCDGKPLKFGCKKDQNRNSALLDFAGSAIFFDGKMGLDADGSPLSKKNPGATDQPETSFRYPSVGKPSVDSDKVPFIVIPGGGFAKALGVQLGDIAAVVHGDKIVFALVADQGPVCKLGEGSIELHERLGHEVCLQRNAAKECTKLRDLGIERDVLYFIFKGSKAKIFNGLSPENINDRLSAEGPKLLDALRTGQ
jgi:hypothetical protein